MILNIIPQSKELKNMEVVIGLLLWTLAHVHFLKKIDEQELNKIVSEGAVS